MRICAHVGHVAANPAHGRREAGLRAPSGLRFGALLRHRQLPSPADGCRPFKALHNLFLLLPPTQNPLQLGAERNPGPCRFQPAAHDWGTPAWRADSSVSAWSNVALSSILTSISDSCCWAGGGHNSSSFSLWFNESFLPGDPGVTPATGMRMDLSVPWVQPQRGVKQRGGSGQSWQGQHAQGSLSHLINHPRSHSQPHTYDL